MIISEGGKKPVITAPFPLVYQAEKQKRQGYRQTPDAVLRFLEQQAPTPTPTPPPAPIPVPTPVPAPALTPTPTPPMGVPPSVRMLLAGAGIPARPQGVLEPAPGTHASTRVALGFEPQPRAYYREPSPADVLTQMATAAAEKGIPPELQGPFYRAIARESQARFPELYGPRVEFPGPSLEALGQLSPEVQKLLPEVRRKLNIPGPLTVGEQELPLATTAFQLERWKKVVPHILDQFENEENKNAVLLALSNYAQQHRLSPEDPMQATLAVLGAAGQLDNPRMGLEQDQYEAFVRDVAFKEFMLERYGDRIPDDDYVLARDQVALVLGMVGKNVIDDIEREVEVMRIQDDLNYEYGREGWKGLFVSLGAKAARALYHLSRTAVPFTDIRSADIPAYVLLDRLTGGKLPDFKLSELYVPSESPMAEAFSRPVGLESGTSEKLPHVIRAASSFADFLFLPGGAAGGKAGDIAATWLNARELERELMVAAGGIAGGLLSGGLLSAGLGPSAKLLNLALLAGDPEFILDTYDAVRQDPSAQTFIRTVPPLLLTLFGDYKDVRGMIRNAYKGKPPLEDVPNIRFKGPVDHPVGAEVAYQTTEALAQRDLSRAIEEERARATEGAAEPTLPVQSVERSLISIPIIGTSVTISKLIHDQVDELKRVRAENPENAKEIDREINRRSKFLSEWEEARKSVREQSGGLVAPLEFYSLEYRPNQTVTDLLRPILGDEPPPAGTKASLLEIALNYNESFVNRWAALEEMAKQYMAGVLPGTSSANFGLYGLSMDDSLDTIFRQVIQGNPVKRISPTPLGVAYLLAPELFPPFGQPRHIFNKLEAEYGFGISLPTERPPDRQVSVREVRDELQSLDEAAEKNVSPSEGVVDVSRLVQSSEPTPFTAFQLAFSGLGAERLARFVEPEAQQVEPEARQARGELTEPVARQTLVDAMRDVILRMEGEQAAREFDLAPLKYAPRTYTQLRSALLGILRQRYGQEAKFPKKGDLAAVSNWLNKRLKDKAIEGGLNTLLSRTLTRVGEQAPELFQMEMEITPPRVRERAQRLIEGIGGGALEEDAGESVKQAFRDLSGKIDAKAEPYKAEAAAAAHRLLELGRFVPDNEELKRILDEALVKDQTKRQKIVTAIRRELREMLSESYLRELEKTTQDKNAISAFSATVARMEAALSSAATRRQKPRLSLPRQQPARINEYLQYSDSELRDIIGTKIREIAGLDPAQAAKLRSLYDSIVEGVERKALVLEAKAPTSPEGSALRDFSVRARRVRFADLFDDDVVGPDLTGWWARDADLVNLAEAYRRKARIELRGRRSAQRRAEVHVQDVRNALLRPETVDNILARVDEIEPDEAGRARFVLDFLDDYADSLEAVTRRIPEQYFRREARKQMRSLKEIVSKARSDIDAASEPASRYALAKIYAHRFADELERTYLEGIKDNPDLFTREANRRTRRLISLAKLWENYGGWGEKVVADESRPVPSHTVQQLLDGLIRADNPIEYLSTTMDYLHSRAAFGSTPSQYLAGIYERLVGSLKGNQKDVDRSVAEIAYRTFVENLDRLAYADDATLRAVIDRTVESAGERDFYRAILDNLPDPYRKKVRTKQFAPIGGAEQALRLALLSTRQSFREGVNLLEKTRQPPHESLLAKSMPLLRQLHDVGTLIITPDAARNLPGYDEVRLPTERRAMRRLPLAAARIEQLLTDVILRWKGLLPGKKATAEEATTALFLATQESTDARKQLVLRLLLQDQDIVVGGTKLSEVLDETLEREGLKELSEAFVKTARAIPEELASDMQRFADPDRVLRIAFDPSRSPVVTLFLEDPFSPLWDRTIPKITIHHSEGFRKVEGDISDYPLPLLFHRLRNGWIMRPTNREKVDVVSSTPVPFSDVVQLARYFERTPKAKLLSSPYFYVAMADAFTRAATPPGARRPAVDLDSLAHGMASALTSIFPDVPESIIREAIISNLRKHGFKDVAPIHLTERPRFAEGDSADATVSAASRLLEQDKKLYKAFSDLAKDLLSKAGKVSNILDDELAGANDTASLLTPKMSFDDTLEAAERAGLNEEGTC